MNVGLILNLTNESKKVLQVTQKTIALVTHDHKKADLVKWCLLYKAELSKHKLIATVTTGELLKKN